MVDRAHSTVREGVITGIIGATAVALWFLIVDLVRGRPFYTPSLLSRTLLTFFGEGAIPESGFLATAIYTVFHYLAFIAFGILAVWLVHRSEGTPSILAGFLILFVALQLGIFGLLAVLAETSVFGELAWYQIGFANLLAIVAMAFYLNRTHPTARGRFGSVLGGRSD